MHINIYQELHTIKIFFPFSNTKNTVFLTICYSCAVILNNWHYIFCLLVVFTVGVLLG